MIENHAGQLHAHRAALFQRPGVGFQRKLLSRSIAAVDPFDDIGQRLVGRPRAEPRQMKPQQRLQQRIVRFAQFDQLHGS